MLLYTIYDTVAEEAGPPYMATNDGVAKRQFKHTVQDSPFEGEFRLYCLGIYDQQTMTITYSTPREVFASTEDTNG